MNKKIIYISLLVVSLSGFSCKDFMDVKPEDYLTAEEAFENADDAISAIYGLYGLMQKLVDQIYLFGEAQGDLVVATPRADKWVAEIAQNSVTSRNPYTDYTNFYRVIVACNNAEEGLANIRRLDPVNYSQEKYELNIAEIAYVRIWTYLQLTKIWENVPYLDRDVTSLNKMHETPVEQSYAILQNILADALEYYSMMQKLRLPGTAGVNNIIQSRSQFTAQAATFLLCEIYLYLDDLPKAWETIRPLLPYGEVDAHVNRGIAPGLNARYWDQKIAGLTDTEALYPDWCLYLDFDGSRGQTNQLQYWTNNKEGGSYALKPSSHAIRYWDTTPMNLLSNQLPYLPTPEDFFLPHGTMGNKVNDSNGDAIPGAPRDMYRGRYVSYWPDGKDTLISKYILKEYGVLRSSEQNDQHSQNDACFLLYRTLPFYYVVMEIMNNMGMPYQALRHINGGDAGAHAQSPREVASCMPFKLDPAGDDPIKQVNAFILEEMAMEGAFEGLRWFDLVRFAKRPGYETWLSDLVSKKYNDPVKREAIKSKLTDRNYWHFPYYYRNVDLNPHLVQRPGY